MPDIRCESRLHKKLLAGSALLWIIAGVGIPHAIMVKIFREYATHAGCHSPAVLARFGWSFERFRSPLHFWYIVLKWRSILICAITTLDDGAVQLFCGSAVIAVEQTLSLLFRPYEKTLLNGVDTAGFVLVAAFASSTIVLFSDEAHRFKQTWLVSVVAFVVAAFGAVAAHEVLAKRDRLFKQAAAQETKRRFRVDDHRGSLSKRLSDLQHRASSVAHELVDAALHRHGRSSPSSRDAPEHAAEGGRRVDPELLLDAVAELSDTLCGKPWRAFVTDPDTSDAVWDDYRDASLAIRPFVCDASPTSRYSADARACYWRLFCKARPRRPFFFLERDPRPLRRTTPASSTSSSRSSRTWNGRSTSGACCASSGSSKKTGTRGSTI